MTQAYLFKSYKHRVALSIRVMVFENDTSILVQELQTPRGTEYQDYGN